MNYIPVYKKMKYTPEAYIERILPSLGEIIIKADDEVVPFTKVARAKISKEKHTLPKSFSPSRKVKKTGDEHFVYSGDTIGRVGFKKIVAPYNGTLKLLDPQWILFQEEKDFWLLSGVWGTVHTINPQRSVTLKTQTLDINFAASTPNNVMGEMVVFPNPSELLDLGYLENFSKHTENKVIYVGNHIRKEVVEKAITLKVGALIGGSIERSSLELAREHNLAIAVTTGFGKFYTPKYIFDFLKTISSRHVFLNGKTGTLQIPMPPDNNYKDSATSIGVVSQGSRQFESLRQLTKGLAVVIFVKAYFGMTGKIDDVQDNLIYVKLDKSGELVQVKIPNILALA